MRCGCHTTKTAPWSSELRFMHSKSNIPTNKSVEFSCKDFGSSLLAENVTPNNFSSLLSPLGGASMNTGIQRKEPCLSKYRAECVFTFMKFLGSTL
ncbi:hypothetical protein CMV_027522 [Castanea mollissima]|uniref:Uncharacterized protein n=1 Tax=Castanea mollissima TaxID=60419 RepID=A0A8J4V6F1_9ROSI|nr:hypothetical protein CMV_027522 [Castanea mollissima]